MGVSADLTAAEPVLAGFPSRLRRIRDRRGLTRPQAAERARIAERTLAVLESNQSNPSLSTLLQLERAYGVDAAFLLARDPRNPRRCRNWGAEDELYLANNPLPPNLHE